TSTSITDASGNTGTAAAGGFSLDTVAPTAPTVTAATVATVLPTIVGTAVASQALTVSIGTATYSVTADSSGQWSLDLATATPASGTAPVLVDGQSYSVTATSTDTAGNFASDTTANELTVQLVVASIAITSDPDNLTNDTTPLITGTSSLGTTPVTVSFGDATYTVTPDSGGNWTLDTGTATPVSGFFSPNVNGSNAVVASVRSPSGTRVTATQDLVIDTTAAVISVTSVSGDSVSATGSGTFDLAERGFDATSYTLNSSVTTLPVISGTTDAPAGQTVTVTLNRVDYTATVLAGAGSNTWSITLTDAAARALNHGGSYSIAARVSDAAGNIGYDLDNGLAINVAPPDVPTVVSQTAGTTTPTLTGSALKKVVSTAAETTAGTSGTAEVQTLSNLANALGANQRVTLAVGGTSLVTAALDSSPTVAELAAALVAATGYSAAPFTVAASSNNLVLTWKTPGVINDIASLTSFRSLETGDVLNIAIKDSAGTTTLSSTALTVGGSSTPAGLTYNATTGAWTLAVGAAANLLAGTTYNIEASTSVASGGTTVTRSDLSTLELTIIAPPSIASIPEAASGSLLNAAEAQSDGGTTVNVSLAGTGAVAGQVLVVSWGAQTLNYLITAADVTAGTAAVNVPTAVLQAETPDNTTETIAVSVRLEGASSASQNVAINFIRPSAPTINNSLWTASGAANSSDVSGIGEAVYDINSATHASGGTTDNVLYLSETAALGSTVAAGTIVRVQLPTSGANLPVAGDSLTVNFGSQAFNAGLISSAHITAKYVDVTLPDTVLLTQPYGTVSVSAQIVSAATGSPSLAKPVSIQWAWDLPLAKPAASQYGFAINGASASDLSSYQVGNIGDFNGDGYDDIAITAPQSDTNGLSNNGATFVVYGKPGLQNVELSGLSAGGSSEGFMIRGGLAGGYLGYAVSSAGDTNGDGLADLLVASTQSATDNLLVPNTGNANARTFVIFGTSSNATINLSSLASSQGYSIQNDSTRFGNAVSPAGDVNADGFDDLLIARGNMSAPASPSGAFILYGTSEARSNLQMVDRTSAPPSAGFYLASGINTADDNYGYAVSGGGDLNGDGFDDVLASMGGSGLAVLYGGSTRSQTVTMTQLSVVANSAGFIITDWMSSGTDGVKSRPLAMLGDVNGDGLVDIGIKNNSSVGIIFGKSGRYGAFAISSLTAAGEGFTIQGSPTNVTSIGDFNGDGLGDLLVTAPTASVGTLTQAGKQYLIYGKTGSASISLSTLAASEGFVIRGETTDDFSGYAASAAGDVNGDGLADLLIGSYGSDPNGKTMAGRTYVVFGGVSDLQSMVFQAGNGDVIGISSADTLTGTTGANQIIGGDGNDTLIGSGGADVLYGGRGDDSFVLNADNITLLARNTGNSSQAVMRVDGGSGLDTLRPAANLDLTQIRDAALRSIERIDLVSANLELRVNAREVINLTGRDNIYNTLTGYTATATGGALGWGTSELGNQLLVDGDANDLLVLGGNWFNLGSVESSNSGATRTYKVLQSGSATAQVLVDDRIQLSMPPAIATGLNELPGGLTLSEAQSAGGTTLRISLLGTGAASGDTLRLTYGSQTFNATVSSSDASNGYLDISLTTAQLFTAVANGTSNTVNAQVLLIRGGTTLSSSDPTPIASNFITPTAPIISSTAWSSSGTSSTSGIPEALNNARYTSFTATTAGSPSADNTLYFSEVSNSTDAGTWVRVQIPTAGTSGATIPAVAGDSVVINWGSQSNAASVTLTSTDITNKYVDLLVPWSAIQTQNWGTVNVSAQVVSAAGNASAASAVDVSYVFDLPLVSTGTSYGFRINGRTAGETSYTPSAQDRIGDVNGDGYDDFAVTGISGFTYIVFGKPGLNTVELSDVGTAANSGFRITGISTNGLAGYVSGNGDLNGDGLADIAISPPFADSVARYVVYGKTSGSTVAITSGNIAASDGIKITAAAGTLWSGGILSFLGDVNGDGLDDLGTTVTASNLSNYVVIYGTTSGANIALPWVAAGGTFAGGYQIQANGLGGSFGGQFGPGGLGGDINGDGYFDVVTRTENWNSSGGVVDVFFGGTPFPGNESGIETTGNGRGYQISGFTPRVDRDVAGIQDINGDGRDDIIINFWATMGAPQQTYVLFGKTSDISFSRTEIHNGPSTNGFVINGGVATSTNEGHGRGLGDFNGDGL
ncbi:MAG: hypothetical protein EBT33_17715, partial [Betaproteobacteria bacterium]|nr:hypothetical protein [Betaproteobacteria bacterium]